MPVTSKPFNMYCVFILWTLSTICNVEWYTWFYNLLILCSVLCFFTEFVNILFLCNFKKTITCSFGSQFYFVIIFLGKNFLYFLFFTIYLCFLEIWISVSYWVLKNHYFYSWLNWLMRNFITIACACCCRPCALLYCAVVEWALNLEGFCHVL